MENENDQAEVSNQQEEEVLETSNEEVVVEEEEVDWKAEAEKAKELANNQRIRAEKAERLNKDKPKESSQSGDLSTKDLYALMESKVPQDDIDEVRDYAKLKNISIPEALKSSIVKSILSEKAEQRNVAKASNTGSSRRGSGSLTDEMLLANLKKGVLPENDEDIVRLAKIRK